MFALCRLCGGPGTTLEGPGAPCRRCIQRVTAHVARSIAAPVAVMHGGGSTAVMTGMIPLAAASVASLPYPDVLHQERPAHRTSTSKGPLPAMYVDRVVLQPAVAHLPPRGVDAVLIAVMPVLLFEVATRATIRSVREWSIRRRGSAS